MTEQKIQEYTLSNRIIALECSEEQYAWLGAALRELCSGSEIDHHLPSTIYMSPSESLESIEYADKSELGDSQMLEWFVETCQHFKACGCDRLLFCMKQGVDIMKPMMW